MSDSIQETPGGTPRDPRDLARYLPLSARRRFDESRVTGDWGPRLAELLGSVNDMLAGVPARTADRPDVAAARDRLTAALADVKPRRRVRVPALGAVLIEALELSAVVDRHLVVDPVTSGAVALDRILRASFAIRAVAASRTLRATDAGWEFGSGPELTGTAAELILFLYGRAGVPGS